MSSDEQPTIAWQPFTPRGVAAFARAKLGRLLLVQLVFGLLAAAAVAWSLRTGWFPVITAAVNRLPDQGEIRNGILWWKGDSPQTLSENRFLAITVDLRHSGQARSPAHVQVELGQTDVRVISLLGLLQTVYPRHSVIGFNHTEMGPWWGAWRPAILALVVGAVVLVLMLNWAVIASLYCWIAWLLSFFADRQLNLQQSWHLAGAALMPGAVVQTIGIILYGLGALDPIQLLIVTALHFNTGWIYLIISPFWSPRHAAAIPSRVNPFKSAK